MNEVEIELGLCPPSVNGFYAHTGRRRYLSKKGREFKEYIEGSLWQLKLRKDIPHFGKARLKIELSFFFKGKRKRDTDNYIKPTIDCLSGILFDDDEQVDEVIAKRYYRSENYKTLIKVTAIEKASI